MSHIHFCPPAVPHIQAVSDDRMMLITESADSRTCTNTRTLALGMTRAPVKTRATVIFFVWLCRDGQIPSRSRLAFKFARPGPARPGSALRVRLRTREIAGRRSGRVDGCFADNLNGSLAAGGAGGCCCWGRRRLLLQLGEEAAIRS
jgi:hypothetical protein